MEQLPPTSEIDDIVEGTEDTRSLPEKFADEALLQCLRCIVSRGFSEGIVGTSQLAECAGLQTTGTSSSGGPAACRRFSSEILGPPLLAHIEKSAFRLTENLQVLEPLDQTPEHCEKIIPRAATNKGGQPQRKPVTTSTAPQALIFRPTRRPSMQRSESQQVLTTESIEVSPQHVPLWLEKRIFGGKITAEKASKLIGNVRIFLHKELLRIGSIYDTSHAGKIAWQAYERKLYDEDSGEFLAPGVALACENERTRRALLHTWGVDWLIYGKRLDPYALRGSLQLPSHTSLIEYSRQVLQRIEHEPQELD